LWVINREAVSTIKNTQPASNGSKAVGNLRMKHDHFSGFRYEMRAVRTIFFRQPNN
jgi:hypothetical protein